jgi:hypothetical protein
LQVVLSVLSDYRPACSVHQSRATATHRVATGDSIAGFADEHHRPRANIDVGATNTNGGPPHANAGSAIANTGITYVNAVADDRGCTQR